LISSPSVRGYIFNDSDIEEIAGVLNAYPGVMYRPEKTRKIFASWSCRKSIMIGRALKHYEMVRVVRNMGKIENPWVSCYFICLNNLILIV
jgi:DNA mismatch repair protein PMS2